MEVLGFNKKFCWNKYKVNTLIWLIKIFCSFHLLIEWDRIENIRNELQDVSDYICSFTLSYRHNYSLSQKIDNDTFVYIKRKEISSSNKIKKNKIIGMHISSNINMASDRNITPAEYKHKRSHTITIQVNSHPPSVPWESSWEACTSSFPAHTLFSGWKKLVKSNSDGKKSSVIR